jgi:terminase small subunit-like protein
VTEAWRPVGPAGLGSAGRELWERMVAEVPEGFRLDERELRALEQACRCADDAAALEEAIARDGHTVLGSTKQPRAHPALVSLIRLRGLEASLLAGIDLEPQAVRSPAQSRSSKAASTRWAARRRTAGAS